MGKNVKNFGFTRTGVLRILSLTVIMAFLLPAMTNAQGKANFAGNWTYNASKSTQPPAGGGGGGGRGGFGGGDIVATQEANLLTVATSRPGQDGTPVTTTMKYTLDGKESINTTPGFGGGDPMKVPTVATYSADGKSLTIVTTRTFNDQTMKTTEVWELTDPRTLTISSTRPGFDGGAPTTTKRVYDKK
jgi:hypothetical protein